MTLPEQQPNGLDYAGFVCTDVGLKCLSQKLQSLSDTNVGRCLGLDEEIVCNIHNDSTCANKKHALLAKWSYKTRSPTWGMLSDCFRTLNDDSLMKEIEQIARDTGNSEDRGIQLYCTPVVSVIFNAIVCFRYTHMLLL